MIGLVFFIVALAVFAFLAVRFGVDSRPDSTDPRSPAHPVGIS
jgi:hypothetical protein